MKGQEQRVQAIPNAIETYAPKVKCSDIRRNLGLKEDEVMLTCVAHMNYQKNHVNLLEAVRIAVQQYGQRSFKLVLVGAEKILVNIVESLFNTTI